MAEGLSWYGELQLHRFLNNLQCIVSPLNVPLLNLIRLLLTPQACKDVLNSNLLCSYRFQFFVLLLVGSSKASSLPLIFKFVTNTYFVLFHSNLVRHQGAHWRACISWAWEQ